MPQASLPISHIAKLARLELTPDEAALFETQLEPILEMIDKLKGLNLGDVAVAPVPPAGIPPLRDDVPHPGLTTEAALQNAPSQAREQFSVPRVIDAE